jgi:maleylacetoacetate isomerase
MRQLVEIVCSDTQPVQNLFVLKAVSEDKKKQGEWARLFVERGLGAFERVLETTRREGVAGRFAMGDELTLADLFLVPQLYNARRFHVELGAFPRCVDIEAAAKETDSYRASCPDAWEPK